MSYDIYCYKSKLGKPDIDEADAVIEADDDDWAEKDKDAATKLAIVKALIGYNPKLEAFDFDYGAVAELTAITIEEAKNKFDHIELNSPEGELAVQIIVYDNHVFINVPYWYTGHKAEQLFKTIKTYIKIIREAAGYFVYDPQEGKAFDPAENDFEGLDKYLSVSEHLDEIIKPPETNSRKKPWWKFW